MFNYKEDREHCKVFIHLNKNSGSSAIHVFHKFSTNENEKNIMTDALKNKNNRNVFLLLHKPFQASIRPFSKQSINSRVIPMARGKQDISSSSLQTLMGIKNA